MGSILSLMQTVITAVRRATPLAQPIIALINLEDRANSPLACDGLQFQTPTRGRMVLKGRRLKRISSAARRYPTSVRPIHHQPQRN